MDTLNFNTLNFNHLYKIPCYGFNGKEKDPEGMGGGGSTYDYGFRIYNPQIAKFLSVDPLSAKYAMLTPYQFASNSPISGIDLDGLEFYYAADGKLLGKLGTSTQVMLVTNDKIEQFASLKESYGELINTHLTDPKMNKDAQRYIDKRNTVHSQINDMSVDLGVTNDVLMGFASAVNNETSNISDKVKQKDEAYGIANATINFIKQGGSTQLQTLEDVVMYDNKYAQGATQTNYSEFIGMTSEKQNSKFAVEASINALAFNKGVEGFKDATNGADGWDGYELVRTDYKDGNPHRYYTWSEDSKSLLKTYSEKVGAKNRVDISKWMYSSKNSQIKATAIVGGTLFEDIQTGRGEKKTK